MALKTKTDPFAIAKAGIEITETAENKSISTAEARGEDGFVVAVESFGEKKAPSASYVVTASSVTLDNIVLGKKNAQHIALASISVATSAGAAPTISASGQEVEEGTGLTDGCQVTLSGITVSGLHHAQTFGLFTVGGTGAHLTDCTLSVDGEISTAEVEGVTKASDLTGGKVSVSGTIVLSIPTGTAPTVTLSKFGGKDGVFTTPVSETNPNGDFPTYSFAAEWPLAADVK